MVSHTLNNLLHIHKETLERYTQALRGSKQMEETVKSIFERVIEENRKCIIELTGKIHVGEKDRSKKIQLDNTEIKMNAPVDKKAILAHCADDVLSIHAEYSKALSSLGSNHELNDILTRQQHSLYDLYLHIKDFHDAQ